MEESKITNFDLYMQSKYEFVMVREVRGRINSYSALALIFALCYLIFALWFYVFTLLP